MIDDKGGRAQIDQFGATARTHQDIHDKLIEQADPLLAAVHAELIE
jgi:hypothetical protein